MKQNRIAKVVLIFAALFIGLTAVRAQDMTMDDFKLVQQAFGRDKKVMLGQFLKLDSAKTAKFWPVYDAYEEERKKLGQTRMKIIEDYAKNYQGLTDQKADQLILAVLKNDEEYHKLQKKYYENIKKATTATTAAQFLQFETYIQTFIRSQTQEAIPFIGELKPEGQKPQ